MASKLETSVRAAIPPVRKLRRELNRIPSSSRASGQAGATTADQIGEQVALDFARAGEL